jgi:hypothetical protein
VSGSPLAAARPAAYARDIDDPDLIRPDETAFRLQLTAAELKVTHAALKSLFDDLGHDEADVRAVVRGVLEKLPDEHSIRAIDVDSHR